VNLTGCEFENNVAGSTGGGGGMALWGDHELVLTDCQFVGNSSALGGGAIVQDNGSTLRGYDLHFEGNSANSSGGGVRKSSLAGFLHLEDCQFDSQTITSVDGYGGAGLYISGEAVLVNCSIESSTATGNAGNIGGGLHTYFGSSVYLESCTLRNNTAHSGGALFCRGSLTMDSCWVQGNSAATTGGAVGFADEAECLLQACTFVENSAGSDGGAAAFYLGSAPLFEACTFYGNDPDHLSLYAGAAPQLVRCLLTHAFNGPAVTSTPDAGVPALSCTDIWGNYGGDWTGIIADQQHTSDNFSANPRYCDHDADDLTLYDDSPCAAANSPCGQIVGAWGVNCESGVSAAPEVLPNAFALAPVTPNPFNPMTRVTYTLPEGGVVELAIYDAAGRLVRVLVGGETQTAGRYEVVWDGCDDTGRGQSSGLYFVRLRAGDREFTRKAVLIR
jgi:hypothetical protein